MTPPPGLGARNHGAHNLGKDDRQAPYVPTSSTSSPQCLALIGHWLEQCTLSHDRCNASSRNAWVPTRLLDLGSIENPFVRLVVVREATTTGALREPYGTLSHCWGRSIIPHTTQANFHQHLQGLRENDLPKTFREAISYARSLHVRYLWIDSLCIVQDSRADWEHEAATMSTVYRYAFINIAATGAVDGSEGCFWERDPAPVRPTFFSVLWITPGAQTRAKRYQVVENHNMWARKLLDQPLNRRGWTFQERILSPRVIHFGNQQVFWECRECIACETYPLGLPASLRQNTAIDIKSLDLGDESRDDKWSSKYIFGRQRRSDRIWSRLWNSLTGIFRPVEVQEVTLTSALNPPSVYKDWDAVVELYSQGKLTFAGDKLIALAGLASSICENGRNVVDDGYLAGLWHSSLPSHLLWTTEGKLKGQRHDVYTAPSWSWASIDGRISFRWCQRNYDFKDYLATVEACEVEVSGRSRFGQVQSGSLQLTGPLASVSYDVKAGFITQIAPGGVYRQQHSPVSVVSGAELGQEISLDCLDDVLEGDYDSQSCSHPLLTLLPVIGLARSSTDKQELACGLVLVPITNGQLAEWTQGGGAGAGGPYRRLGFFWTTRSQTCRILKNLPRQTVTIK